MTNICVLFTYKILLNHLFVFVRSQRNIRSNNIWNLRAVFSIWSRDSYIYISISILIYQKKLTNYNSKKFKHLNSTFEKCTKSIPFDILWASVITRLPIPRPTMNWSKPRRWLIFPLRLPSIALLTEPGKCWTFYDPHGTRQIFNLRFVFEII